MVENDATTLGEVSRGWRYRLKVGHDFSKRQ